MAGPRTPPQRPPRHPGGGERAGGRGLGAGGPRRVQRAGCLEDGCGGAAHDRRAGEAADDREQRPRREPRAHLRGGARAVAADQARGLGPGATPPGQEPAHEQRLLRTGGPCARAPAGGHQRAGAPCKAQERQRASVLRIMIVERPRLLAVGRIVGRREGEHEGRRRLRRAGAAGGPPRLGAPREVLTRHPMGQPRAGGRPRQVRRGRQGRTRAPQLTQGIAPAAMGERRGAKRARRG
jgi:hypothetical protein